MAAIASFIYNSFQENTYVVYDNSKSCVIIDPGCYTEADRNELVSFITNMELKPKYLINTHCHIDHIFGNQFIANKYGIPLMLHNNELPLLRNANIAADLYGMNYEEFELNTRELNEDDEIQFGNTTLKVMLTPGHSQGSISLYNQADEFVIVGDVIFLRSIGRYDLPGGDLDQLMNSINQKILTLPDEVTIYPGHGPTTTVGFEKHHNPFVLSYG